jgi:hypothetical protein
MAESDLYSGSTRVTGGVVEVVETVPGVMVAFWLEDPYTEPPGGLRDVPKNVVAEGGEAALKWAVNEWNEKRLGRS